MAATDERAIHEFPTGTIDDNSLLIMDRPTSTPGEYETEKFAIANLGLKLLGGIDFPSNLDTEEQDIFGAINEVNAKAMNIADEYDETASYSKGDYCIYQNASYRCVKASGTTTGTFVAADWTQIKVLAEVKANTEEIGLKQNVTDNNLDTTEKTIVGAINELHAINGYNYDAYDDTATYAVGDLCIYNNTLYKCTTAITVAEAWNSNHWAQTSIADELSAKADSATTYTKSEVDTSLNNKQDKLNKGTLGSTVDLDTLFANSVYYLMGATTTQHAPCSYGLLEVVNATITLQRVTQVGTSGTTNLQYERIYINNVWTSWRTITRS